MVKIFTMNTRKRLINLKVNQDEFARIHELALLHAGGNVSLWLRSRGMTCDDLPEGQNHDDTDTDGDEAD